MKFPIVIMAVGDVYKRQGVVPGVYHFSDEGVCSWYDFAKAIHRIAGITTCKVSPLHTNEYTAKAPRPHYSVLDKTKVKTTYNIESPHWEDVYKRQVHRHLFYSMIVQKQNLPDVTCQN